MTTPNKDEQEARLQHLEREYALATLGLNKLSERGLPLVILGILGTVIAGIIPLIWVGRTFLSGTHIVIIVGIVAASLMMYCAFVFGRAARIRAEISRTKKMLDIEAGDSVR